MTNERKKHEGRKVQKGAGSSRVQDEYVDRKRKGDQEGAKEQRKVQEIAGKQD
jgi:hypothetical protein